MAARPIFLHQLPLGPMRNFVYLVGTEGERDVYVVDPAWDVDAIEKACTADGKWLAGIFLTHSHKDHINGVAELLRRHDLPVYAQRAEIDFSPDLQAFGDALRRLGPGDRVGMGGASVVAVHTPGHTPGSQCLFAGDALVAGDTLFVNGCGRCDLLGGDPAAMFHTLTGVLGKLPPATRLFPGHDYGDVPVSSLGREAQRNPYFQFTDAKSFVTYRMRPRR
ncbi:MAG TPA: MBL fold metallo-hydrolase [Myxococcaceae bacterium]|jgi:glyoxylase-like metal-dependent hydrolase (beta-lactamase superfamily II)|nr:MBL fold metallo-hydrolase [Myxococcaceae bacterium]